MCKENHCGTEIFVSHLTGAWGGGGGGLGGARGATLGRKQFASSWEQILSFNSSPHILTLSYLQTNTDTFANSADPDETARKRAVSSGSTLLPFCFFFFFCFFFVLFCFFFFCFVFYYYYYFIYFRLNSLLASVDKSKFKNGRVHFRKSVMKRLIVAPVF